MPQNVCGGSIYSETVVVTAAHCCKIFEDTIYDETWFEVIAGDLILYQNSGSEQRSKIKNYLIHPDYCTSPATNDICLLYLEDRFDLSGDNVKSISLATVDPEPATDCLISGWGLLEVRAQKLLCTFFKISKELVKIFICLFSLMEILDLTI